MPSESIPWDRKEYFKMRKEGRVDSVGSDDSREVTRCGSSLLPKRLVDVNGVTILKGESLAHDLSQPCERILENARLYQFKHHKLSSSSVCDEESCGGDSQVFSSPKESTPDSSASILADKSYSAFHKEPVGLSHQESTSMLERIAFEGDMDQKLADRLQHSSNQGHTDDSVGLGHNTIRWMRSGSFSSHESGLSNSVISNSMSADFSNKVEVHKHNMNSWQSASGDTVSCVTPSTPSEETSPWKRPRLKWGEGLAKFEKKSLVHDSRPNKSETFSCTSAQLSECASPATPSSAACSSFPGSEDKPFTKAVMACNGNDSSQTVVSETLKHLENFPFKLEKVDLSIINDAVPSLIEMLNFDQKCSVNFSSASISVMNKLLLLKSELLKAVDITESDVDLLENELKSIYNESGHYDTQCLMSGSPAIKHIKKSGQVTQSACEVSRRPDVLLHEIDSIVDTGNSKVLKADVDSAGSVTSKLAEHPSTEPDAVSGMINDMDIVFEFDASPSPQEAQKSPKITSHAGISDSGWHMAVDDVVVDSIWASNRDWANKATEGLNIVYPLAKNIDGSSSEICSEDMFLRELLKRKKKAIRFKEQAAALKWRATHCIRKDDTRLFSVRKHCSKAQKKLNTFLQTVLNNCPSVHSKSLHVNKSSLNTSKLRPCRSFLKMPALILDDDEKKTCIFLSSNGLVEDPYGAEKERYMINSWSSEERDIFWEKLASHGKNFRKIACFLDHKSTADCVQFYYKNHKSQSVTKTMKQHDRRKIVKSLENSTYLVTPAKQWERVVDTAALDILGAASELVAKTSERKEYKKDNSFGFLLHCVGRTKPSRKDVLYSQRPIDYRVTGHEIRTSNDEMLPSACGSVSPEAVSSCISGSVNQGKGHFCGTRKTFSILRKPPPIPEDILIDDEETCSDESSCELDVDYWTDVEKSVFVRAVQSYGKDFCMVSRCIQTKSKDQCKSFYSKACKCLGLDIILPDNKNEQQSVVNDSNSDQSAPVLASTQEAVPDIGDHKVSQRMLADLSASVSVISNLDSLSPDAGMASHVCHDKLKDRERDLDKSCADLKVECQLMDKSAPDPHLACVRSKPTMSNGNDKQAFPRKYSDSTNKLAVVSPSLSFSVPYFGSLAHLGKEKGFVEPPLLQYHVEENDMSVDYIKNKVSCIPEDCGTLKVPCQRSADNQPFVGSTAAVPRQVYAFKGPARVVTSQNRLAFRTSCGLLNSTRQDNAGFPAPEISFAKNSFGELGGYFQGSHYPVNRIMQQTYAPSNQFYFSQTFKKNVKNKESAWNLNFEDSTISRGSLLECKNGLPSYAIIPQTDYIQRCPSPSSNPLVTQLSYLKPSSHINSMGPEKQEKQSNIKLFGKVLIPSTSPESPSLEKTELTQLSQIKGSPQ